MTKISQLSDIGASLAGGDEFVIRDVSDATTPNKKVTSSGIIDYVIGTGSVTGFTKISAGAGPLSEVACTFSGSTGTITMGTASAGSPTERVRISSSGRVGIGTSAPSELLSVNNPSDSAAISVRTGGALLSSVIKFNADDTNYAGIGLEDTALVMRCDNSSTPTERVRISSSGRVGIGTSAPRSPLQVQGGDVVLGAGIGTSSATLDVVSNVATNNGQDATPGIAFRAPYDNSPDRPTYAAIWSKKESGGQGQQEGSFVIGTNSGSTIGVTEKLRVNSAGRVGIGTSSPTTLLDVNADTVRVRTARTPASASATGAAGEICWDASYIYVCTATNTWKRAALSTW